MRTTIRVATHPTNRVQGDKFPICIFFLHNQKWSTITLDVPPVASKDSLLYDEDTGLTQIIDRNYKNRHWANTYINGINDKYNKALRGLKLRLDTSKLSVTQLITHLKEYRENNENADFQGLMQEYEDEKNKIGCFGTARCMRHSINSLSAFKPHLTIGEIDYSLLKSYETWYLARGNSYNGLSVHLRDIRKVYRIAIKRKIISKENYPFEDYTIKKTKTTKRAVKEDCLQKIIGYTSELKQETLSKDLFTFSFYCAGMNYIDMAYLKKTDIQGNRLVYSRRKTGDFFNLPLNNICQSIIEKYRYSESPYVFPIVLQTELIGEDLYRHIKNRYARVRKKLCEIGKNLDIPINLTSYVARHTFATIAKKKNVPITAISELLGHEDIKTTQIYLSSLESDVLDKYLTEITG
ncbi:MAG: site-specific integrase [Prevotellaceae bacterium]|jgi:site-specific recombinase XerD|nr:site-specific integrase [Prevotellaceae bacterium]